MPPPDAEVCGIPPMLPAAGRRSPPELTTSESYVLLGLLGLAADSILRAAADDPAMDCGGRRSAGWTFGGLTGTSSRVLPARCSPAISAVVSGSSLRSALMSDSSPFVVDPFDFGGLQQFIEKRPVMN